MRHARKQEINGVKHAKVSHVSHMQQRPNTRQILVLISAVLLLIAAGIGLYLAWVNFFTPGSAEVVF